MSALDPAIVRAAIRTLRAQEPRGEQLLLLLDVAEDWLRAQEPPTAGPPAGWREVCGAMVEAFATGGALVPRPCTRPPSHSPPCDPYYP